MAVRQPNEEPDDTIATQITQLPGTGETPPGAGPADAEQTPVAEKTDVVKAASKAGAAVAIAVATAPSPTVDRIDQLAAKILAAPAGMSKEIQAELARPARLLPKLRVGANQDLVDEVAIAVRALLLEPPNLDLARRANSGAAQDIRFRSYTPATRMLVGVAILSYFFAFGWLLAGGEILDLQIRDLVGPAVFGWLGSVASIVTRINNFRNVANPLTVGATRPVLGSAFGIFTYLALTSGIVSFANELTPQFYLAVAFVAGFSERFVPDLISQFESETRRESDAATDATVVAQAEIRT